MVKPVHILARHADVAPLAVTVGDPARAEQLAHMLKDARLVNANRGFMTYTGVYNGKRVTVATHGIGGPSSAIVFEELRMLGATTIVRLGTCGGMIPELQRGDVVIPTGAAFPSGSLAMYVPDGVLPPVPDMITTSGMIEGCKSEGVRHMTGFVFSSDAFYAEDPTFVSTWSSRGVIAVEMECATLFTLGTLRKFRTAAVLIVSDSLVKKSEKDMVTAEGLKSQVERVSAVVLKSLTRS